jgi:hypothetical protein
MPKPNVTKTATTPTSRTIRDRERSNSGKLNSVKRPITAYLAFPEPSGISSEDRTACVAVPVVTLTMNGRDCPEVSIVDAGVTVQVALVGAPVHVRLTGPAKFVEFTVRLKIAVVPACTVTEVALLFTVPSVKAATGAAPDPVSDIVCEPLGSLSVTVRLPVRAPTTRGVKRMLTVQFEPGASTVGQLLV